MDRFPTISSKFAMGQIGKVHSQDFQIPTAEAMGWGWDPMGGDFLRAQGILWEGDFGAPVYTALEEILIAYCPGGTKRRNSNSNSLFWGSKTGIRIDTKWHHMAPN